MLGQFSYYGFFPSISCLHSMQPIKSLVLTCSSNKAGTAVPLQDWTGPEGFRRLRLPDFKTIDTYRWQVCQPYAPAAFIPQEILLVLVSVKPLSHFPVFDRPACYENRRTKKRNTGKCTPTHTARSFGRQLSGSSRSYPLLCPFAGR